MRPGAKYGWIGNAAARFALLAAAVFSWLALPPQAHAQSVVVIVSTDPVGATYMVDNLLYTQQESFAWPIGSYHTLTVSSTIQPYILASTALTFLDWSAGNQTYTTPTIGIIATAAVTDYVAKFSATETLTANVSNVCGPISCGGVPGVILLNGAAYAGNPAYMTPGTQAFPSGSVEILTAQANPGYAFASWSPGADQAIAGGVDTVTLSLYKPAIAVANFVPAVPVTFASTPAGLKLIVDNVNTTTPYTEPLGWGSQHVVSALSPQKDATGNYWVLSSWSDGGATTHTYTVPESSSLLTLTANFEPGEISTFVSSPPGLSLTVDGRSNYTVWNFAWVTGSVHTFSAPATQTDALGNLWGFTGWSNGGPESQTLTVGTTGGNYTADYQQLGQLTVNSTFPGVPMSVNGTACTTPCTVQQPVGTSLTVSAPASVPVGAGQLQRLVGWSNGAAAGNLTISAPAKATTVTAVYTLMDQLATITNPANAATWNLQPASPDGYYKVGTVVNISLSPLPGYQFRNWSGDLSGIEPVGTVVMSQPRSVTALFTSVPYLPVGAVTNGAGPTPSSAVAAGSAITIFGVNLTSDTEEGPVSPMVQTLGGLTVSVGSRLLPLYFVSPGQINAQLPPDLAPGASSLVVITAEQTQVTANFTVAQDAPGLFAFFSNDKAYAIAFHQNGALVTEASPAKAGETLTLYGTGFGPTAPARPEGMAPPASPPYVLTDPSSVQVGTASATPTSAYALPAAVGIDVVEFALPGGAPSGDVQLTVTIDKVVSNTVLLPIQ